MTPTPIVYNDAGVPTNLPEHEPILLYGMEGLDAQGPILGQWDSTLECWSDDRHAGIDWYPLYFAVPPANPCRSISEPTVGNDVV